MLAATAVIAAGGNCAFPALGVDFGVGIEGTALNGQRAVGVGAAVAGWSLRSCLRLPVRIEASIASGTRGPPWWRGVEAVRVRSWSVDLALVGGWSVPFWDTNDGVIELGMDLLVGPVLRITGVATRIQDDEYLSHELYALGRLLVGTFARLDVWRVQLRVEWLFPTEPSLLLGIGYQL